MASSVNFDANEVLLGLDNLTEEAYSVARTMGAAAGAALRDAAKGFAPVQRGKLRDSIYVAFSDESTQTSIVYSVSWNRKKAPHGHLLEFGHWQPYVFARNEKGQVYTTTTLRDSPVWVPAHPFLRPAFDSTKGSLMGVAVKAGRARFQGEEPNVGT